MTVSKTDVEKAKQYEEEFRSLLDSSDFSYKPPQRGEIRNAIILQIDQRDVIDDMGSKRDGIVPVQDLERLTARVALASASGA